MLRAKCGRGLSFRSQLRTSPRCRCALGRDGWAQPRGSVPRSTGPAAPVFQGAKSPLRPRPRGRGRLSPASKCPLCSMRLCSKSFVSGFNPSRAALRARCSAALALPVGSFTRPHPALIMPSAPPAPPLPPQPSQGNIDCLVSLPLVSFPTRPLSHQILPPSVIGWPILATF